MHYQTELANKIRNGRAVGNQYVVTQRPVGRTGIVARFDTHEEAVAWIEARSARSLFVVEGAALPREAR